MPFSRACCWSTIDLQAVQTAACTANLSYARKAVKQYVKTQRRRSKPQDARRPVVVTALQAEREKAATTKRGRPKKEARPQLPSIEDDVEHDIEGPLQHDAPQTADESALQVELYYRFLKAQARGFDGAFDEFVREEVAQPIVDSMPVEEEEEEEIVERGEEEDTVDASLESIHKQPHADLFTSLGLGQENSVSSVEHLLSALEACGIDNARIEIEGGFEIPIIDGSALGWVIELQGVGACLAKSPPDKSKTTVREQKHNRQIPAPAQPVTVRRQDAFITLFPEDTQRLTYGIDFSDESEVVGKQWFTWAPSEDQHYRWQIAPARTFATSVQKAAKAATHDQLGSDSDGVIDHPSSPRTSDHDLDVFKMRQRGLVKGGTEGCAIIGFGDRWREPDKVRFFDDEPVRHKMLDLIGDLSLLADKGHAGIPLGHIIAYKADHALHVEFAQALKASKNAA